MFQKLPSQCHCPSHLWFRCAECEAAKLLRVAHHALPTRKQPCGLLAVNHWVKRLIQPGDREDETEARKGGKCEWGKRDKRGTRQSSRIVASSSFGPWMTLNCLDGQENANLKAQEEAQDFEAQDTSFEAQVSPAASKRSYLTSYSSRRTQLSTSWRSCCKMVMCSKSLDSVPCNYVPCIVTDLKWFARDDYWFSLFRMLLISEMKTWRKRTVPWRYTATQWRHLVQISRRELGKNMAQSLPLFHVLLGDQPFTEASICGTPSSRER